MSTRLMTLCITLSACASQQIAAPSRTFLPYSLPAPFVVAADVEREEWLAVMGEELRLLEHTVPLDWAQAVTLTVTMGELDCGPEHAKALGCTVYAQKAARFFTQIVAAPCVPMSSFVHEMAHVLSFLTWGTIDSRHIDSRIWLPGGLVDRVNARLLGMGVCDGKVGR